MLKRFCDICNKELLLDLDERPTRIQWYKIYKDNNEMLDICNDCLHRLIDGLGEHGHVI